MLIFYFIIAILVAVGFMNFVRVQASETGELDLSDNTTSILVIVITMSIAICWPILLLGIIAYKITG